MEVRKMGKGLNRLVKSITTFYLLAQTVGWFMAYRIYVNFHTRRLFGWELFDVPRIEEIGLQEPF